MNTDQLWGMFRALHRVSAERKQQHGKWGEQNHPDGTDSYIWTAEADDARWFADQNAKNGVLTWLDILKEETFEAFAETDPVKLRTELVQVAAVAVAWVEAIDRRTSGQNHPVLIEGRDTIIGKVEPPADDLRSPFHD